MTTPLASLCARLREMEAKASKAPWRAYCERGGLVYHEDGKAVAEDAHYVGPPGLPPGVAIASTFNTDDSDFIAAARNALPKLLDIVSASVALAEEVRSYCDFLDKADKLLESTFQGYEHPPRDTVEELLRAKLAAWDAAAARSCERGEAGNG